MGTEKTTYLGWDKPVFPSDTLATDLDTLFDQIDVSVNNISGEWSVSDDGAEVLVGPGDLNFGTGLSVTDDGDGSVTLDSSDPYTDTEARAAVDGASLNSLTLSRTGLNSSDSWLEINGGSDGILIGYNQNANDVRSYQDVNLHGGSDFNSRGGNMNLGGGSVTTSNFEVTENSSTNSLDFNYTE